MQSGEFTQIMEQDSKPLPEAES